MEGIQPFFDYLGKSSYLVGNSLSMADFLFYEVIELVLGICEDKRLFEKYPNLEDYHARIAKNINLDKIVH